jgi:hypothetical protein
MMEIYLGGWWFWAFKQPESGASWAALPCGFFFIASICTVKVLGLCLRIPKWLVQVLDQKIKQLSCISCTYEGKEQDDVFLWKECFPPYVCTVKIKVICCKSYFWVVELQLSHPLTKEVSWHVSQMPFWVGMILPLLMAMSGPWAQSLSSKYLWSG